VWQGGTKGEPELLASCYRNSLALAAERKLGSLAFPAISTGVYGYPHDLAAQVAIGAVREFVATHEHPAEVIFCCFSDRDLGVYESLL
jgi:O-acetyl-ADP-ribose deacetylase (regulator of RNase III)